MVVLAEEHLSPDVLVQVSREKQRSISIPPLSPLQLAKDGPRYFALFSSDQMRNYVSLFSCSIRLDLSMNLNRQNID